MTSPAEAVSVLLAVELVVVSGILLVVVPFDVAAPVVPLALVFLVAVHLYRAKR